MTTTTLKSRAAVAFGAGQPLQIVDIDVAPPKKGEVRVPPESRRCADQALRGGRETLPLDTGGGVQQARFITEGDLHRLIASSKLPKA